LLYAALLEKLTEPICLDKSHRDFLNQVFGIKSIDEIQQFLCNDSQDIMTFYDWLFFPDMAFQKKIESILSGRNISISAQSDLINRLVKKNIQTKVQLDSKIYQMIPIGIMIIEPFVRRLNLNCCLPDNFIEFQFPDNQLKNCVLVYLRNASIEWTESRCRFICKVIQSFLNDQEALIEILPRILIFCGQYQDQFHLELTKRKRQLSQNLERFKNHQALQEKHSFELLMSSGVRSVHVDVYQSEAEISMIDSVLFKVYDENDMLSLPLPHHSMF